MSHPLRRALARAAIVAAIAGAAGPCLAQAAQGRAGDEAPSIEEVLQGAERLGSGRVTAWRKNGHSLLTLPPGTLGRPLVWYAEVVAVPAGVVASAGLEVSNTPVRLERRGAAVQVRDLGTVLRRRAAPVPADPKRSPVLTGAAPRDPKVRPIEYALIHSEAGPLIATLPIVAEAADGTLLVDLTPAFGDDIPAATGRLIVAQAGVVPIGVDPGKTYIERVRARGPVLNIRTHLTFLAAVPAAQAAGPQPLSVVLGHSLVFLPEQPMRGRPADPRVGYFPVEFTQFGGEQGAAQAQRTLIQRFRLEKRDPAAAVSDPVRPITFYLGRGVPQRWRPYLRAGVLQWLPAFEAAGISNAIRVLDAPSPQEDPDWTEEDVTHNVIRWLPEERANAMGPRVVDPRSGETLSAHIQIWPSVIEMFGQYYWALFGGSGLDPAAARLPLSTERSGALLSYIVAHEVGHTLGLLHNQIASTAHPVARMRDPGFANRAGPNSSIMAYGRFNQVAQPGDGVHQFWSVLGPYDIAAIRYGYGHFGTDAASEARELAAFADSFSRDRALYFASEETAALLARHARDPRVQTENTGAERVLATRLGVANLLRSLARLDQATGGDAALYASAHAMLLDRHAALLKSVPRLVGGAEPAMGPGGGPSAAVPAAQQREAVRYLLGEGARTLEAHTRPELARRVAAFGMERRIRHLQASLVGELMTGPTVAQLESQHLADAAAYSPIDFGQDVLDSLFGRPQDDSATRRALQRGWLDAARRLLGARAEGTAAEEADAARQLQAQGVPPAAAQALAETGDDTEFVGWLQASLPALRTRLATAARRARDASQRLHLQDMAAQLHRLSEAGR
jgi:hypothetical protein